MTTSTSILPLNQSHPSIPWSLPVPLTQGGFTSLYDRHQHLDVVTDLGQMASFGAPDDPGPELLGYADYQLEPELPTPMRQGAGRAVFHAGHYLKGVGRTPLAVNWRQAGELIHATGHLPASAALREFVVSRYLEAKGLGEHIVPCEGLLVRPMDRRLAARWTESHVAAGVALPPSDTRLQAISVKPGNFARWSNLNWLAQQTATLPSSLLEFGMTALRACSGSGMPFELEDATPSSIVAGLERGFARGWASFEAFVRAGVYWGSFHNNFSLDGRFLDLEVPLVLGEGLCAKVVNVRDLGCAVDFDRAGHIVGWELGFYRRQVANVVRAIEGRFREIARMSSAPAARVFAAQLADALEEQFGGAHLLRAREPFVAALSALYRDLGASENLAAQIATAVDSEEYDSRAVTLAARESGLRFARIEPPVHTRVGIIVGAPGPVCPQAAHERALLGALFEELDATEELDRYLERLAGWTQILAREVRPHARAGGVSRGCGVRVSLR